MMTKTIVVVDAAAAATVAGLCQLTTGDVSQRRLLR